MKTKHTPGEWIMNITNKAIELNPGYYTVAKQDGTIIALCPLNPELTELTEEEILEREANYKLIAAAPNMLKALTEVRRHGLIEKDGYETIVKEVNEAINKATQ